MRRRTARYDQPHWGGVKNRDSGGSHRMGETDVEFTPLPKAKISEGIYLISLASISPSTEFGSGTSKPYSPNILSSSVIVQREASFPSLFYNFWFLYYTLNLSLNSQCLESSSFYLLDSNALALLSPSTGFV